MLVPILMSTGFVLGVVLLCLLRPNAGRIFLGLFFLAMALAVNGSFTLFNPQAYVEYAGGALLPAYRELALTVVQLSPTVFGVLLMAYEIAMGVLLLHQGRAVRMGLIGTMVFLIGISPLSTLQLPWLGLIVAEIYLLSKDFDRSFLGSVRSRLLGSKV